MEQNTQLELAAQFVHNTNKNIFLTGKAGTGKTTFLHNLKKTLHKRMAIVAPTGVAAINAGGVTIHSFFQLPFGPYIPESNPNEQRYSRFNKEKINLIKSLDLLVIDEISMVRADMLDGIDEVLRKYKDRNKPFGGTQLLMIGDLHQLSPVIKDEEWNMLKPYYDTVFFFSSNALRQTDPVRIELKHIYRQSDTFFIDLLNKIRENQLDKVSLAALNERYIPNFKPAEDEGYITLTTHNNTAQEINSEKLNELKGKTQHFEAQIHDDFPQFAYPTEQSLALKIGSQVMFVKNDSSRDKLYYNGKIGTVTRFDDDTIFVKCKGDYTEIDVHPAEWKNIKYALNPQTKEIDEQVIGSFIQYPLKLAWAITIHKSQGLTFEKAIIDANNSFAHGQVYVALSRCKSFEGMVLRTPISQNSVKTDGTVAAYTKDASANEPDSDQLTNSKMNFQRSLLLELFDFSEMKYAFSRLNRVVAEHENVINKSVSITLKLIQATADQDIFNVSDKFKNQLNQFFVEAGLPEENENLNARVQKGCVYFYDKIEQSIYPESRALEIDVDNIAVKKVVELALENFQRAVFTKRSVMLACKEIFNTATYLRAKSNAEIDFKVSIKTATPVTKAAAALKNIPNAELYKTIRDWRNNLATEKDVPVYIILPQKALEELVSKLPTTLAELEAVKGIGKTKVRQFGKELVTMIVTYCEDNQIEKNTSQLTLTKEKADTKKVSFDLFNSGKTVEEIAEERGFGVTTIETHLAHYIGTGELDIFDIFPKEKINKVIDYFMENKQVTLSEAKAALSEDVTYTELRAALKHLEFLGV
ncbi:helix-turn-helix domain-containing protein [Dyadobacter sp. CY356]|uniref:helix-turn-helix domain-containing protein n=1 Tax=Dyadobacter sp. CY356 TaxID=2906442 RepID=UPI001F3953EB|nr:helix-turn-helix domain-containing protein [Dyadobacter sp. CY356]MCF0056614.1 helix-turn-helix domain-containing protein [Dyadobacter sp. CY356]